jgi:hypothetical protein
MKIKTAEIAEYAESKKRHENLTFSLRTLRTLRLNFFLNFLNLLTLFIQR